MTSPVSEVRETIQLARILAGKAAWIICYLALVGAAIEISARGCAWLTFQDRILALDADLGWRLRPGAVRLQKDEERPYWVRVNSNGLRDAEHAYQKPRGVRRIVVLGNSYVYGAGGVEVEDTFVQRLAAMLPRTELINMGMLGFSTDQQFLYLRDEGLRYDPDVVLLCISASDLDQCFTSYADRIGRPKALVVPDSSGIRFGPPPIFSLFDRIAHRSYVAALIDRARAITSTHYRVHRQDADLSAVEKREAFRALVRSFRTLCEEQDIEFHLVCLPDRDPTDPSGENPTLCEVAGEKSPSVVNLSHHSTFANAMHARSLFFQRDFHPNEHGHAAIAEALIPVLRNAAVTLTFP